MGPILHHLHLIPDHKRADSTALVCVQCGGAVRGGVEGEAAGAQCGSCEGCRGQEGAPAQAGREEEGQDSPPEG